MEQYVFRKNILGKEPEWLIQKRKKDLEEPPFEYQRWTKDELNLIKTLLLQNYDYDYIASKVNRSRAAVESKIRDLNLSYRLKKYWKGHEIKLVKDNYQTMEAKELSEILGRTPKAIQANAAELGIKKRVLKRSDK